MFFFIFVQAMLYYGWIPKLSFLGYLNCNDTRLFRLCALGCAGYVHSTVQAMYTRLFRLCEPCCAGYMGLSSDYNTTTTKVVFGLLLGLWQLICIRTKLKVYNNRYIKIQNSTVSTLSFAL